MVLVWTPPQPQSQPQPPHAKDCVSCNCDTNARIKFIFDTAIDDLHAHVHHYAFFKCMSKTIIKPCVADIREGNL